MVIGELKKRLDDYNRCITDRAWTMSKALLYYENEYISLKRIDSSNKWTGPNTMEKMWSIIYTPKMSFEHLSSYKQLTSIIYIDITPVTRGRNKGCYGIRIYGMTKEPDRDIIHLILDFIFKLNR